MDDHMEEKKPGVGDALTWRQMHFHLKVDRGLLYRTIIAQASTSTLVSDPRFFLYHRCIVDVHQDVSDIS